MPDVAAISAYVGLNSREFPFLCTPRFESCQLRQAVGLCVPGKVHKHPQNAVRDSSTAHVCYGPQRMPDRPERRMTSARFELRLVGGLFDFDSASQPDRESVPANGPVAEKAVRKRSPAPLPQSQATRIYVDADACPVKD